MRHAALVFCAAALLGCAPAANTKAEGAAPTAIAPAATEAPAGAYQLDPMHASLIVRVNHLGFANYVARFTRWDAALELDPANPQNARLTATIDPRSITSDNPPAGFLDELKGPNWLNAGAHPQITFAATDVVLTGANTARMTGDLTLLGATHPVTLDVTYGGAYAGHPLDPRARIGFSARGSFDRSTFGMLYGLPPEGQTMGVWDPVAVEIEAEFQGPAWTPPAAP